MYGGVWCSSRQYPYQSTKLLLLSPANNDANYIYAYLNLTRPKRDQSAARANYIATISRFRAATHKFFKNLPSDQANSDTAVDLLCINCFTKFIKQCVHVRSGAVAVAQRWRGGDVAVSRAGKGAVALRSCSHAVFTFKARTYRALAARSYVVELTCLVKASGTSWGGGRAPRDVTRRAERRARAGAAAAPLFQYFNYSALECSAVSKAFVEF
ncbi:hypothetical protein B5X24_HaOG213749 [Helicoverpa armigera]|uniref:Uncharacterized protein n=1 Tax=Helicoverpa armigera TaxID=29058 RepID=A0A2W1BEI1_HELAM|nr:hypothetical protein B5X24_HaOG213749 [Helicoverpa armigera]